MQKYEQDIEQLLADGNIIQFKPRGYSMYPLFVPGRDEALVALADVAKLRRGDVVLYRRDKGILVLHRIWRRKKDRFYLVGDNQKEIEGPLRSDQIKGIMIGLVRKGRRISVNNYVYRILTEIWLVMRPIRPTVSRIVAGIKRIRNS